MVQVVFSPSYMPHAVGALSASSVTLVSSIAETGQIDSFIRYIGQHIGESGISGMPRFSCYRAIDGAAMGKKVLERWSVSLQQPGWGRALLLWSPDALVVGHLEMKGASVMHGMHRAALSMGLLQAYTGQGLGGVLIDQSVDWAVRNTSVEWFDLEVFAENQPARKLYERKGFVQTGYRPDEFRLEDGTSIDAVLMSKRIR